MIGLIKGMFMRPKTVDDFLDAERGHLAKIGGFIGKQQFTEEERATMMVGVTAAVRQFAVDTAKESTTRSKTRRSIAVMWIKMQLALVGLSFLAFVVDHPKAELLFSVAVSDVMFWGTAGIVTFFFGSYGFGTYVKGKK